MRNELVHRNPEGPAQAAAPARAHSSTPRRPCVQQLRPQLFLEQHCNASLYFARHLAPVASELRPGTRITSFTVLREPLALATSSYNYWHRRKLPVKLLCAPRMISNPRPCRQRHTAAHTAANPAADSTEATAELLLFGSPFGGASERWHHQRLLCLSLMQPPPGAGSCATVDWVMPSPDSLLLVADDVPTAREWR